MAKRSHEKLYVYDNGPAGWEWWYYPNDHGPPRRNARLESLWACINSGLRSAAATGTVIVEVHAQQEHVAQMLGNAT